MQRTIDVRQRTNPRGKQYENSLPCLAHAYPHFTLTSSSLLPPHTPGTTPLFLTFLASSGTCKRAVNIDSPAVEKQVSNIAGNVAFKMMQFYPGNKTGPIPGLFGIPYYWGKADAVFGLSFYPISIYPLPHNQAFLLLLLQAGSNDDDWEVIYIKPKKAFVDYRANTDDTSYNPTTTEAIVYKVGSEKNLMPPNQSQSLGNKDQCFWVLATMSAAEK